MSTSKQVSEFRWDIKTELTNNTTTTASKTEIVNKEMFVLSPPVMKSERPAKKQNGSSSFVVLSADLDLSL